MQLVNFFSLFFSLFFQWVKNFWTWPILEVCFGKLNVFLALYLFSCFFKRTEQGPVQSNKMTHSALNSAESRRDFLAEICKWLSPYTEMSTRTLPPRASDFGTAKGHFVCLCLPVCILHYRHKGCCSLSICLHSTGEKLAWLNTSEGSEGKLQLGSNQLFFPTVFHKLKCELVSLN